MYNINRNGSLGTRKIVSDRRKEMRDLLSFLWYQRAVIAVFASFRLYIQFYPATDAMFYGVHMGLGIGLLTFTYDWLKSRGRKQEKKIAPE